MSRLRSARSRSGSRSGSAKDVRYTLAFEAQLVKHRDFLKNSESTKPTDADKEWAKEELSADISWSGYLESAMNEATEKEDVKVDNISIKVNGTTDTSQKGIGPVTNFKGTVSWKSVKCAPSSVKEQIDWFIKDRMSQYEIDNEEDESKSHVYIYPGKLSVSR